LPGERGETKLSKARWSETERAKESHNEKVRFFGQKAFRMTKGIIMCFQLRIEMTTQKDRTINRTKKEGDFSP